MTVWVVTAQAVEQDKYGTIQRVDVRCFGAFTSQSRADQIAAKVRGSVTPVVVDGDINLVLQRWLNPGYVHP